MKIHPFCTLVAWVYIVALVSFGIMLLSPEGPCMTDTECEESER